MSVAHDTWPEPTSIRVADGAHGPIDLAVHEMGEGPAVVFCHGFPELAYSWRHQLPATAAAGFRAIAPDMRGYGGSSRPDAVEAYDLMSLCGDLVGLLDALDVDRAVFVGHDWGGFVAWAMPLLHPDRCAGIVGVCTPYVPFPSTDLLLQLAGGDPDRLYITWFQADGVAEAVMDPKAEQIFQTLMRGGVEPKAMLSAEGAAPSANPFKDIEDREPGGELIVDDDELDTYVRTYDRTGFRGGINWYRNIDHNGEAVPGIGSQPLDLPCLQLTAEWDPALRPSMADGTEAVLSDYERHDIPRAGHWVQQEDPDAVNHHLVEWLTRRFGRTA